MQLTLLDSKTVSNLGIDLDFPSVLVLVVVLEPGLGLYDGDGSSQKNGEHKRILACEHRTYIVKLTWCWTWCWYGCWFRCWRGNNRLKWGWKWRRLWCWIWSRIWCWDGCGSGSLARHSGKGCRNRSWVCEIEKDMMRVQNILFLDSSYQKQKKKEHCGTHLVLDLVLVWVLAEALEGPQRVAVELEME